MTGLFYNRIKEITEDSYKVTYNEIRDFICDNITNVASTGNEYYYSDITVLPKYRSASPSVKILAVQEITDYFRTEGFTIVEYNDGHFYIYWGPQEIADSMIDYVFDYKYGDGINCGIPVNERSRSKLFVIGMRMISGNFIPEYYTAFPMGETSIGFETVKDDFIKKVKKDFSEFMDDGTMVVEPLIIKED